MKCFLNESNCGAGCKAHEDGECTILTNIVEMSKSLKSVDRSLKDLVRMRVRGQDRRPPKP